MGYRPLKLKGISKATTKELIECVEKYLYNFAQTSSFDSGHRLSEVEAYLQGIKDARLTFKNSN